MKQQSKRKEQFFFVYEYMKQEEKKFRGLLTVLRNSNNKEIRFEKKIVIIKGPFRKSRPK